MENPIALVTMNLLYTNSFSLDGKTVLHLPKRSYSIKHGVHLMEKQILLTTGGLTIKKSLPHDEKTISPSQNEPTLKEMVSRKAVFTR